MGFYPNSWLSQVDATPYALFLMPSGLYQPSAGTIATTTPKLSEAIKSHALSGTYQCFIAHAGDSAPSGNCLRGATKASQFMTITSTTRHYPQPQDESSYTVGDSLVGAGVRPEKITVTYLGLNPESLGIEEGPAMFGQLRRQNAPPLIGAIANYRKIKGLEYLIDAADLLFKQNLKFQLVIVGKDHKAQLESYVSRAKSKSQIKLAGFLTKPWTLMAYSDCLVIPSLSEGVPQVAVEALALRVPVVATNVGGLSEIIVPDITGLLVPPRDPEQLASAIHSVISSTEMAARIRDNGLNRFHEKFTMEAMCNNLLSMYRRIA